VFTIGRIERSRSTGLGVHDQTESVFTIHRNTHPRPGWAVDRKARGNKPLLNPVPRTALAAVVRAGPNPAIDGVVRWRFAGLAQWVWEKFRISISRQTLGSELRKLGFRKLSARPRHHEQAEGAIEDFRKNCGRAGGNRRGESYRSHRDRNLVQR
jgi:hypothetical protein